MTVSTVNVVINLREGAKPTLRFETVVSGRGLDDLSWRYSSRMLLGLATPASSPRFVTGSL